MRGALTSALILVSGLISLGAQREGVLPREAIALVNASVVNVRTGAIGRNLTVLLRDGRIETVLYQFLAPMLLNEYQKQQRTINAQDARIAGLEHDRQVQAAEIASLRSQAALVAEVLQRLGQAGMASRSSQPCTGSDMTNAGSSCSVQRSPEGR